MNHIYDQNTGNTLAWKDKYIKCAINDQPIYAGKDEVIFSLDENFQLFMTLYAHFLENLANDDECNIQVIAHYIDTQPDGPSTLYIKYNTKDGSVIGNTMHTSFYLDPWLCYIESIFILNGNDSFDVHNFDQVREKR